MSRNEYDDLLKGMSGQEKSPGLFNEYDAMIGRVKRTDDAGFHQTMATATAQSPDRAADVEKISKATQLPAAIVDRQYDYLKSKFDAQQQFEAVSKTPVLKEWLTNPINASISHDDLPGLGKIDRTINFAINFARSMASSLPATSAALWGAMQTVPDLLEEIRRPLADSLGDAGEDPFKRLSAYMAAQRKYGERVAARWRGPQTGAGFVERSIYSGGESLAQNLMMLLPAFFTGGASEGAVLGAMGTVQGGQSYGEARDQGVAVPRALTFGLSQGLVEAGTEMLPLHTLLGELHLSTGFTKLLARELASEIPGEQVATILQDMNEWAVLHPEKPFSSYIAERPSAAAQTLIATLVGTVGVSGITRAVAHVAGKPVEQQFFEQLGKGVEESKTFQRLPEKLQEFITHATKDGPIEYVYQPIDTWNKYWQSKAIDPRQVAQELMGSTEAYDTAVSTGSDFQVPLANYAGKLAATEHNAFFSKELRLHPDEMNAREAQAFIDEAIAAEPTAGEESTGNEDSAAKIGEDVIGQLVGQGFDRAAIDAYAQMYEAFFRTTVGERAGFDPKAFFDQYALKIGRPLPEILQKMGNFDVIDAMIDRLRKGDTPDVNELFGKSLLTFVRENGGVQDEGGDLDSREVDKGAKPFTKKVIQKDGLPLDAMRERAAEAGYLPAESSVAEFLDKLDEELRGNPVYTDAAVTEATNTPQFAAAQAMNQLASYLKDRGVDLNALSNEEVKKILADAAGLESTGGDVTFSQKRGGPQLSVLHKLSSDGLIFADSIGGLPVPSLAVVPGDMAMGEGYGDVTLIGKAPLGDPTREAIFDADIYSATFPRPEYPKVKSKVADAVVREARPFATKMGDRRIIDEIFGNAVNSPKPEETVRVMLQNNAAKAWFLSTLGINVDPVMEPEHVVFPWVDDPDFKAAYAEFSKAQNLGFDDPVRQASLAKLTPAARAAIQRYAANDPDFKAFEDEGVDESFNLNRYGSAWGISGDWVTDGSKEMPYGTAEGKVRDSLNKLGKTKVDDQATETLLNEKLAGHEAAFKQWVENKILPMYGPPFLKIGKKKLDYTLDNIVDYMTSPKIKAQEKTMTFGEGKARAAAAKRFGSLDEMRRYADSIGHPDVIEAAREEAKQAMESWRDRVIKSYGTPIEGGREFGRVWEGLDASMRAIARWARGGKTVANLARALSREGFRNVPDYVVEDGVEAGKLFLKAPVPYFEAKPQRAVKLNEFAGAVIPTNASDVVKEVLDRNGLPYRTYDPAVPGSSQQATIDFRNELAAGGQKVLFQPAYHGSPHVFDEFSLHKIGSGEGAQAYGWGLYFAGDKSIAEYYRKALAARDLEVTFDGKQATQNLSGESRLPDSLPNYAHRAIEVVHQEGSVDKALDALVALIKSFTKESATVEFYRQQLQWLKDNSERIGTTKPGRLYTVDIPGDDDYLAWDKRISEQSDNVFEALTKSPVVIEVLAADRLGYDYSEFKKLSANEKAFKIDLVKKQAGASFGEVRAERLYEKLADYFGTSKKLAEHVGGGYDVHVNNYEAASRYLSSIGIPGIRYLDSNSRDLGHGNHNYVVFDDKLVKITSYEQGDDDGNRGSIRFGSDRQFNIDLLANADLSTFIHESGHFYLEVFGDVVQALSGELNENQVRMQKDYATLLKWLGVESRDQIAVEQHEKFARALEAYMLEGKAPAAGLRGMFARFRSWLVSIYRSLSQLNVELTPEVRGVMDRLFATDQEITAAQEESGIAPLFSDASMAGMTDTEFQAYKDTVQQASDQARDQLQGQLMEQYRREREAWWKAERAKVRETVAADVQSQPIYIALSYLQYGTLPDGSPLPEGVQAVKLDKKALVDRYGKEFLKRLPRPYVYAVEGGVTPDVLADMFGFSSGDQLMQDLVNVKTRPMKQLIDAETDDQMRTKYGDILLDGSLHDKAKQAVMTAGRSEVIETELKALAKKRREVQQAKASISKYVNAERRAQIENFQRFIPKVDAVRYIAERRVAAMKVRDLRPQSFFLASRRASKAATEAALAQNFDAALAAKQQELFAVEMYRASTAALDEIETAVKYIKTFGDGKKRSRIGLAGQDYLDQIDGLLERFDFAKVPLKVLDRRKGLADWLQQKESEGLTTDVPEQLRNEAFRKNFKDMTIEELRGLRDSVKMIDHMARLKNRLLKSKRKRELDAAVAEIDATIRGNGGKPGGKKFDTRLPGEEMARGIQAFFAAHRKLASLLREMDGFEDGGVMWDYIMRPINEAADREAVMNERATIALNEIFTTAYPPKVAPTLYEKTFFPAIDASLTKMERLMMALNVGNDANKQRLLDGYKLDERQLKTVLDTLDERDWKFVQGILDHVNSYWPEIKAKQERVVGVAPEKVQATTVQTAYGDFPGGYFPIKYNDRLAGSVQDNLEGEFADMAKNAAYVQKATTRRGHTKERLEKVELPLRLDFGVIFEHVTQVIHDLSHHEMLIDVGRLLGHKTVQQAITDQYGDIVRRQLKGVIKDIAFGQQPTPEWYKPLAYMRRGVVTASLAWNAFTSLLQPFQVTNAMVRVGPKWVWQGIRRWISDAASLNNTVEWIESRSEFMRLRGKTQLREINEIRNQAGLKTSKFSAAFDKALSTITADHVTKQAIVDSYFQFIQMGQKIADVPTWLAGYEKAMAADGDEERASALADQAVIDSQGSGHIKDLAAVERQGEIFKVFTTFYSYANLSYNLSVEAVKKYKHDQVGFGRMLIDTSMMLILPAVMSYALRAALVGNGPDDDETLMGHLLREELGYLLGLFIGTRELAGLAQGFDYTGPSGLRWINSIYQTGKQIGQGDLDASFWRSLNDSAGILLHYPAKQVERTAQGIDALWSGETRNPAALLFGYKK